MPGSFKELEIWKTGYELLMEIYDITAKFPSEEKYGLTSQLRRSANSIIANIAEAHGRYHFADKIRTLYQARAECTETQSHLEVAKGLEYIEEEKSNDLNDSYQKLNKGISAFIISLNRRKSQLTS